jgi:hypothetical protein
MIAAVAVVLALPFVTVLQADSFKALYDGRWIASHGLPSVEALTLAAHGRAWIDEQWLGELAYYESWALGGYGLVAVISALAIGGAYAILAAVMLRRGASRLVVAAASLFALLTGYAWTFTRAQDLALPLFAALLAICLTDSEYRDPQRRLALLVPLLVLWANIHGSVLLGAALATLYLLQRAGRTRRNSIKKAQACVLLALCTAVSPLATPYGLQIVHYYGEFVGNTAVQAATAEWSQPTFPMASFFELYAGLAVVAALGTGALLKRRRVPAAPVGAALICAVAAWAENGNLVWFGMAAAILLSDIAPTGRRTRSSTLPGVLCTAATALAVIVAVTVLLATRSEAGYEQVIPARVLASVTAYAQTHPCASVLADNWDASALLWQSPSLAGRIGYDARIEQYAQAALNRWTAYQAGTGRDWAATTSGYQILIANTHYTPVAVKQLTQIRPRRLLAQTSQGVAVLTDRPQDCPRVRG